jgi:hypothetical protein
LWYILPEKEIDRVWTKLLPKKEYILDKERYKIMIAHYSVLEWSSTTSSDAVCNDIVLDKSDSL